MENSHGSYPLRLGCDARWVTSTPNYSCRVTSRGRRWRSSRAGTINQRRLACSQGDRREVFKAGAGAASITVGEAAGEEQRALPPARKQDARRFPTCRLSLLIIKIGKLQLTAGHGALFFPHFMPHCKCDVESGGGSSVLLRIIATLGFHVSTPA